MLVTSYDSWIFLLRDENQINIDFVLGMGCFIDAVKIILLAEMFMF